jgi:predicted glycogen debranching enzyme
MRRRSVIMGLGAAPLLATTKANAISPTPQANWELYKLGMSVTSAENRQYSYTDKVSGYFHGRTHADDNPDWFNGWNIATKRVFHDYRLSIDDVALRRGQAVAQVWPHQIERRFERGVETLALLDGLPVIVVRLTYVTGRQIGVRLTGDLTDAGTLTTEGVYFAPKEAAGSVLLVAPIAANVAVSHDPIAGVSCAAHGGGFLFIHGATQDAARQTLANVQRNLAALLAARAARMEALISGNRALDAGDPDRTKALLWMRLTGDQLVTKQLGTGIYAGLPWFNDYWGRDTFISITGILFVNGQYKEAAEVFESFAALQDTDPNSKTYGRVPNRARPDGIEYNSADGTPRFISALAELVTRSGDTALARRLWPAVRRAVEGMRKNNVDALGLITHDDADTWMDAKEKGVRAWSPRGNRAIDVQALWIMALEGFHALAYACELVRPVPHIPDRRPKSAEAIFIGDQVTFLLKLEVAINTHFVDAAKGRLVDHLKPDGTKDYKLRPNALFALPHIPKRPGIVGNYTPEQMRQKMGMIRRIWQGLVYPWGVATLSQDDPDFHPYHEHWHYYHKDAAYHNGTVWPWLNGVAMDALLDFGVVDQPWSLFENMNRQALKDGAVGSLAECADALPLPSATWSRRTGTFLQAWSNAEHLRVWQEGFLGLRANETNKMVHVVPRLPKTVLNVKASMPVGAGCLHGVWHDGDAATWSFRAVDTSLTLYFTPPDVVFGESSCDLKAGERVTYRLRPGYLDETVFGADGTARSTETRRVRPLDKRIAFTHDRPLPPTERSQERYDIAQEVFAGLDFCQPHLRPGLKSLSVRHDPPLTY